MSEASGRILRLYKNAAAETIAVDEISMSGTLHRDNVYRYRGSPGDGQNDWGDWKFLPNGRRKVSREFYRTTVDRVIVEIECIGGWANIDTVNFDWFDFVAADITVRVDMTDLPDVGDSV